jgi:hypothetical protein
MSDFDMVGHRQVAFFAVIRFSRKPLSHKPR